MQGRIWVREVMEGVPPHFLLLMLSLLEKCCHGNEMDCHTDHVFTVALLRVAVTSESKVYHKAGTSQSFRPDDLDF